MGLYLSPPENARSSYAWTRSRISLGSGSNELRDGSGSERQGVERIQPLLQTARPEHAVCGAGSGQLVRGRLAVTRAAGRREFLGFHERCSDRSHRQGNPRYPGQSRYTVSAKAGPVAGTSSQRTLSLPLPTYSSWLNMVEVWLQHFEPTGVAKSSSCTASKANVRQAIDAFVKAYSKQLRQIEWTKAAHAALGTPAPLLRFMQVIT